MIVVADFSRQENGKNLNRAMPYLGGAKKGNLTPFSVIFGQRALSKPRISTKICFSNHQTTLQGRDAG
jgi:hypothetical protein